MDTNKGHERFAGAEVGMTATAGISVVKGGPGTEPTVCQRAPGPHLEAWPQWTRCF